MYVKESRREEFCRLMEAHGEVINFESEVYRRDGSKIWISENAHVVRGARGEFICYEGTVQDITERRSYLRRFPLDIIKIDRSLVTGIEHEEEVAMIARAVISLGQSLRKTVVAEGVENQAQFDFLRYQGCDEFQGYQIARPMPAADFAALLARTGGQL